MRRSKLALASLRGRGVDALMAKVPEPNKVSLTVRGLRSAPLKRSPVVIHWPVGPGSDSSTAPPSTSNPEGRKEIRRERHGKPRSRLTRLRGSRWWGEGDQVGGGRSTTWTRYRAATSRPALSSSPKPGPTPPRTARRLPLSRKWERKNAGPDGYVPASRGNPVHVILPPPGAAPLARGPPDDRFRSERRHVVAEGGTGSLSPLLFLRRLSPSAAFSSLACSVRSILSTPSAHVRTVARLTGGPAWRT
jgi:hypothetical protein